MFVTAGVIRLLGVILHSRRNIGMAIHTRGMRLIGFLAVTTLVTVACGATSTLRIVSYNIDDFDQGNDNNITASYAGLPTVLQAIGQHHIGTNAQPIDVLGLEELNSTTLGNLAAAMNSQPGVSAGTYAYYSIADPNTGGGADGLIYNTHTVQVVSAITLADSSSGAARRQSVICCSRSVTARTPIFTCTSATTRLTVDRPI